MSVTHRYITYQDHAAIAELERQHQQVSQQYKSMETKSKELLEAQTKLMDEMRESAEQKQAEIEKRLREQAEEYERRLRQQKEQTQQAEKKMKEEFHRMQMDQLERTMKEQLRQIFAENAKFMEEFKAQQIVFEEQQRKFNESFELDQNSTLEELEKRRLEFEAFRHKMEEERIEYAKRERAQQLLQTELFQKWEADRNNLICTLQTDMRAMNEKHSKELEMMDENRAQIVSQFQKLNEARDAPDRTSVASRYSKGSELSTAKLRKQGVRDAFKDYPDQNEIELLATRYSVSRHEFRQAVEGLFTDVKAEVQSPDFKLNPGCSIVCPLIAFLEGSGGDKPEMTTRKGNCEAHQVTYNFGMENISSSKLKVASFAPLQQ